MIWPGSVSQVADLRVRGLWLLKLRTRRGPRRARCPHCPCRLGPACLVLYDVQSWDELVGLAHRGDPSIAIPGWEVALDVAGEATWSPAASPGFLLTGPRPLPAQMWSVNLAWPVQAKEAHHGPTWLTRSSGRGAASTASRLGLALADVPDEQTG